MLDYTQFKNRFEKIGQRRTAPDFKSFAQEVLGRFRRTSETAEEYASLTPAEQTEIKDCGGFIAGTLREDKRAKNRVEQRGALVLDIDGDTPSMKTLQTLTLVYPCRHFWYTTHKSTAQVPRYRIVCDFSRPVTGEEYGHLSRGLCRALALDVDPTTHQPERLMFYPSASADGDYRQNYYEGKPLDVDTLLALTPPEECLPGEITAERQADPRTKPGIVGAFCRVYSIDRAIRELIPQYYAPAGEGRYTYKDSTTAAGAVAMDNGMYLYSFHSSDPNAGKLLNAFDLVRLVCFADRDANSHATGTKLPSYRAMEAFCMLMPEVADQFRADAVASLPAEEGNREWLKELAIEKNGKVKASINNYELVLRNDPSLRGAVRLNEFAHRLEVVRQLPWRKEGNRGEWTDSDDAGLRGYVERNYSEVNRANLMDAVCNVYEESRYHPVRDYLEGLRWDGVRRLDTLLVSYMGAEDTPYTRAVTRKALCGAVARVYNPGVKYDYVLTLVGREGFGKSSLFAKLGGPWFSDSFLSVSGKESIEQLQGVWIMEIGELAGLKKAEVESIKAYISSREDRVRLAYARRTAAFPRECIFVATTNNPSFLRSANGNRRFWPVEVGRAGTQLSLWEDLDGDTVDQVWAEAKARYREGEELFLRGEEASAALAQQEQHQETDEWASAIAEYLEMPLPEGWNRKSVAELMAYYQAPAAPGDPFRDAKAGEGIRREAVCPRQIWCECFGRPLHELDPQRVRRINAIMHDMKGWERAAAPRKFGPYGLNRCYVRQEGGKG